MVEKRGNNNGGYTNRSEVSQNKPTPIVLVQRERESRIKKQLNKGNRQKKATTCTE